MALPEIIKVTRSSALRSSRCGGGGGEAAVEKWCKAQYSSILFFFAVGRFLSPCNDKFLQSSGCTAGAVVDGGCDDVSANLHDKFQQSSA